MGNISRGRRKRRKGMNEWAAAKHYIIRVPTQTERGLIGGGRLWDPAGRGCGGPGEGRGGIVGVVVKAGGLWGSWLKAGGLWGSWRRQKNGGKSSLRGRGGG